MTQPTPEEERVDLQDRLDIEAVLALYGHLVDTQSWDRFHEVFADDATFDATSLGLPLLSPRQHIQDSFAEMSHPVAHLTTNLVFNDAAALPDGDGSVSVRSKFLCPLRGGKVLTGEYRDTLVRTAGGWRIARRQVSALRPREGTL